MVRRDWATMSARTRASQNSTVALAVGWFDPSTGQNCRKADSALLECPVAAAAAAAAKPLQTRWWA